jgi:hypothetical protein
MEARLRTFCDNQRATCQATHTKCQEVCALYDRTYNTILEAFLNPEHSHYYVCPHNNVDALIAYLVRNAKKYEGVSELAKYITNRTAQAHYIVRIEYQWVKMLIDLADHSDHILEMILFQSVRLFPKQLPADMKCICDPWLRPILFSPESPHDDNAARLRHLQQQANEATFADYLPNVRNPFNEEKQPEHHYIYSVVGWYVLFCEEWERLLRSLDNHDLSQLANAIRFIIEGPKLDSIVDMYTKPLERIKERNGVPLSRVEVYRKFIVLLREKSAIREGEEVKKRHYSYTLSRTLYQFVYSKEHDL